MYIRDVGLGAVYVIAMVGIRVLGFQFQTGN